MRVYRDQITELKPNQIFVFGANREGRHGKGAALFAKQKCGAIYGRARGLQGRAYGIVTKDLRKCVHPSVSTEEIETQIRDLYRFALENQDKEFVVAYSGSGTNLNGYSNEDMAKMFACQDIPENICFEEEFANMVRVERSFK